jgi:DNA-binding beta-propeller fold protein YncE
MKLAFARVGLLALATLGLGSCGGGGGSGGGGNNPPPPASTLIVIDDGNAEVVGELSFSASSTGYDAMQLLTSAALTLHQSLLAPQTYSCHPTGTIEFRATDEDNNARFSNGDRVAVSYDNCENSTGGLELQITNFNPRDEFFTALDGPVTLDIEFSNGHLTANGDMKFRLTSAQLNFTGTDFTVAFDNGAQSDGIVDARIEKTITNDNDGLHYSLTIAGTAESDYLDGTFEFHTSQEFTGTEGEWPVSGMLVAEGRSNSRATFEPGRAPELVDYHVNGGQGVEANWPDLLTGSLFGIYPDDGGEPPPPPPAETLGRRLDLGGYPEDVVVDNARSRIYVTVPERNEVLVISAPTLSVIRRVVVGSQPAAASMSLDGQELFIGLLGAGAIAVVDLDTFSVSQIVVAPTLESSTVYDVVETSPGILFVSSGDTFGSVVRLDRATGIQTEVTSLDRRSYEQIDLLADPMRGVLYVGDGWGLSSQKVFKLDSSQADAPVLVASDPSSLRGTHRMSLDPTGTRLYLYGGQVLSTADFSVIGTMDDEFGGMVWAADNGQDVMVANSPGSLSVYSAATLTKIDEFDSDCALDPVWRLAPSPVDGQWVMLGANALCVIDINNPQIRPGSSNAGLPGDPTPQRNVAVVDMDVGGQVFDVEYDHSRNRAYLSLPTTDEIVTIDVGTRQIIDRKAVSSVPHGIDLSPDEGTLAIIFNGNGNIGFMDMTSGAVDYRDLTLDLGNQFGNDVAYVSDAAVFATVGEYSGYAVRTSRLDPANTVRVANEHGLADRATLLPSADGAYMYLTNRTTQVMKLDLSKSWAPIATQTSQFAENEILGADRVAISPDGAHLVDGFGQVLRTTDFTRAANISRGTPLYSASGSEIFAASVEEPGRIDRVDAASFVNQEIMRGNCSIAFPRRLIAAANDDVLITTGESRACFWFLDQPPASSMRIGPQSAYVCDAGCLMRKLRRESVIDYRRLTLH